MATRMARRDAAALQAPYNGQVLTRGIREFVARDWDLARESKDTYWGERIARLGPAEGFRIAEELRRQAVVCDASWPDPALRQADLSSHARLADLFRRVDSARRP